jgi:hypothetical protein
MRKNKIKILLYSVAIMVLAGCTSTKIVSSWREPDKTVVLDQLDKVLVVAMLRNETNRHNAEDQMVGYLKGKGVAAYSYLDHARDAANEDILRRKLQQGGFDGAITMTLIDVDKEENYTPGNITSYPTYYRNFRGYYTRRWTSYSTPGYYSTTKTYTVETNVYSLKEDRIIWTGLTESTNPGGVKKMTEEITKVVYKRMVKEGFVN